MVERLERDGAGKVRVVEDRGLEKLVATWDPRSPDTTALLRELAVIWHFHKSLGEGDSVTMPVALLEMVGQALNHKYWLAAKGRARRTQIKDARAARWRVEVDESLTRNPRQGRNAIVKRIADREGCSASAVYRALRK